MSYFKSFKSVVFSLLVSLFALTATSANADQFNFSYTFSSGYVASGSFSGIQNGKFVDNISNVSVSLNGNPFVGSPNLFAVAYNVVTQNVDNTTPAIVSFDALKNNFMFIDVNYPTDPNYTNYFLMRNDPNNPVPVSLAQVQMPGPNLCDNNACADILLAGIYNSFDPARWSLTAVAPGSVTPVPEPEIYAMLMAGLGLLGVVARRRKQKAV